MYAIQPGLRQGIPGLRYREFAPAPETAGLIDRFYLIELDAGVTAAFPVVADATSDLVIDLDTPGRTAVTSALITPHHVPLIGPLRILGLRFRPGVLRALQAFVPLERDGVMRPLTPGDALANWAIVTPSAAIRDALMQLQTRLLDAWRRARLHPAIGHALTRLEAGEAVGDPIPIIARELSLSERQFRRLFQQQIGVAPVAYRRIRRTQAALQSLGEVPHQDLARLAADFGYSDQAQMSREFAALTGFSPTVWRGRILQASDADPALG